jgi:hypothetical protein
VFAAGRTGGRLGCANPRDDLYDAISFTGCSGRRAFCFLDPDGNRIERFCWMTNVTQPGPRGRICDRACPGRAQRYPECMRTIRALPASRFAEPSCKLSALSP